MNALVKFPGLVRAGGYGLNNPDIIGLTEELLSGLAGAVDLYLWLLASGLWNEDGVWLDIDFWKDLP